MKKNVVFICYFLLALLTAACKKSENSGGDTPVKKLKYLSKVTTVQESGTLTNTYIYDTKNRLVSQITKNSAGASESETTYAYNGNELFEIEIYNPAIGFRDVTEFSYASDKTIATARKRTYRNNNLNSDVIYSYYYTNGKISQIKHEIYTDTYTYDSRGNVIKRYSDEFNFTSEWTYDDKPSATTNGFPKYIINSTFAGTPNNVLTRPPGTPYTYVYDAEGYPVSATSGTAKITYTYVEM